MKFSQFIYRQRQKLKYHLTKDSFEKKVAEINQYYERVKVQTSTFTIVGCGLNFSRKDHSFIVNRFELFLSLLKGEGTFVIQEKMLLFNIHSIYLRVTTAEELFIINEIFINGCYRVFNQEKFNVIDIGMNVGFASLFFANNLNVEKVISFEPFQFTYLDALVNFSLNQHSSKKISHYNFGLGLNNRKVRMSYSSHLKGKNTILREEAEGVEIELRSAIEVFDRILIENSEHSFFVKMDCEGAEFEIFESLETKSIPKKIFGFIIEWHGNSPQPIIDTLLQNGFKIQQTGSSKIGLIVAFR